MAVRRFKKTMIFFTEEEEIGKTLVKLIFVKNTEEIKDN